MTHKLKCWPAPFDDIVNGRKTVELRRCDDREFEPGDVLILREWRPPLRGTRYLDEQLGYTGRWAEARVSALTFMAGPLSLRGTTDGLVYPLVAMSIQLQGGVRP